MKKTLLYITILLLIIACESKDNFDIHFNTKSEAPLRIKLDTINGYLTNTLSGDSIKPIRTENLDTLQTGKPLLIVGNIINPDSGKTPKITEIPSDLTTISAHSNVHFLPENIKEIKINFDSLYSIAVEANTYIDSNNFILDNLGDTTLTGVPLKIKGVATNTAQSKPVRMLPKQFKDNVLNNMQYIDVEHGLVSSYVLSILEDSRGNMWLGTSGGGVTKYDGQTCTNFSQKEGLTSSKLKSQEVLSMLEDRNGNIWFGLYAGGLSMYNGQNFTQFTKAEGLSDNIIVSMIEDHKGNLWFGTGSGGVSMYDGTYFTHFTTNEGLSNNTVYSILEDSKHNLWFGTYGGGVTRYDGSVFTHFTKKDGLSDNIVLAMEEDRAGNIWFTTYNGGVTKYNGHSFTHYGEAEGLSNNMVYSVAEDDWGNLWFGTYGGGVNMFDGKSFTTYTTDNGLSHNKVLSINKDSSGNLWFGTYGGGVSIYNGNSFSHFTKAKGLSEDVVYNIIEDKNGNLWFATYGGGICRYDGNAITHYGEKEGLAYNNVLCMLEDRAGKIWIGTYGAGISIFDGKSFTTLTQNEGLSNNIIWSMLEDSKGNIWIGTFNNMGLTMYNGENFTQFTEKEGFTSKVVLSIHEDKEGNMWFGTASCGVCKYDGKTFTYYTEKEGLSNNTVMSIEEDSAGNLWFGTRGGGISVFDGEYFTYYTESEGLSNNQIWSIIEDRTGNIWVSTDKGLNKFEITNISNQNRNMSSDMFPIVKYNIKDGLKAEDFYPNSAFIDSKNRAWWGSGKSLTSLDLNKYKSENPPPNIRLTRIDIKEHFIDYRNLSDSLSEEIAFTETKSFENYPINLKLNYNENHLTFHFVGIDWSAPHKIRYSYRLKGLKSVWSNPTSENKAEYKNLPFGNFTFEVRARSESGEWSESIVYSFEITPPWWHTYWFRVIAITLAVLLIYSIFKWRVAKLRRHQKELEAKIETATQNLQAKNEELAEKNHEIQNQKEIVEGAHKEIKDSIYYAERIQRSFLASQEYLETNLSEHFVFFQPKEAVSGDFYWASQLADGNFALVNADSTGHGVPGAIMSMLNISSLELAVKDGLTEPAEIFNSTRTTIIERLKKDGSKDGGKDGMDATLIVFNKDNSKLKYALAQNPIWVVRNGKLHDIRPEKMPLGKHDKDKVPFTGGEFNLKKGDLIYSITDGYHDQFGGPRDKKYLIKRTRKFILAISHLPLAEQHRLVVDEFFEWKGEKEQIDDVCVLAVKI